MESIKKYYRTSTGETTKNGIYCPVFDRWLLVDDYDKGKHELVQKKLDEPATDLLLAGIVEIRQKIYSNARVILLPIKLPSVFPGIKFTVPVRGEKKKLSF